MPARSVRSRAVALAPAGFVLTWSTGFVSARYVTQDAGPFTFLSIRMAIAAALLAGIAGLARSPRPDRTGATWAAAIAVGLHVVYLGGVFVAIDLGMPTGLSALIAGLHPVVTAMAAWVLLGERLLRIHWIGVALGFTGVALVVVERMEAGGAGEVPPAALVAMAASVIGISAGTLAQRARGATVPLLWGTVVQYIAAALLFGVVAASEGFELRLTGRLVLGFAWAVVVLSIASVLVMLWMLNHHAAARVSSLFFLTPALSTIEGALLFGERLGALALVGLSVALAGVALTMRPSGPQPV